MSDEMALRPLIAICGTTGVGKSKLAIELALGLNRTGGQLHGYHGARIINADSMQVYAGMDIITNKVPIEEMHGVEHSLMGFKQPGEQYVVGEWVRDAMQIIEETHRRNQIPIVVGGTSYWIQHLMFPNRLSTSELQETTQEPVLIADELAKSLSRLPPELFDLFNALPDTPPSASTQPEAAFALHALLSALDPPIAQRWHWKDSRKVLRSLNVIKESGQRTSEIIAKQSQTVVKPRYRTLCFWLYANPTVLNPRLDARVNQMIEQGLVKEIYALRHIVSSATPPIPTEETANVDTDYTLGIFQSIGYKEFHAYLSAPNPSEKLFQSAVERMKTSTQKYAKRQIGWIRNKLLPAVYAANAESLSKTGTSVAPIYLLDASELGHAWITRVSDMAYQIMDDFLHDNNLIDPLMLSESAREMLVIAMKPTDPIAVLRARRKVICPICTTKPAQPVMIEEGKEWTAHVKTRLHRRLAGKQEKDTHMQTGMR